MQGTIFEPTAEQISEYQRIVMAKELLMTMTNVYLSTIEKKFDDRMNLKPYIKHLQAGKECWRSPRGEVVIIDHGIEKMSSIALKKKFAKLFKAKMTDESISMLENAVRDLEAKKRKEKKRKVTAKEYDWYLDNVDIQDFPENIKKKFIQRNNLTKAAQELLWS